MAVFYQVTLIGLFCLLCFSGLPDYSTGELKDSRDGRVYKTVKIDGLEWMAENLNFRTEGSMCYSDHPFNCRRMGRLYTWWEANRSCPEGWRLPSDKEWNELYRYYGSNQIDVFLEMVKPPFNAKMGGWYTQNNEFKALNEKAYFWSSTIVEAENNEEESARYYGLNKINQLFNSSSTKKEIGFSCRCVRGM